MLNGFYGDGIDEEYQDYVEVDLLSEVTEVVEWLKENKPSNEDEMNELIRLIVDWDIQDDVEGDRYRSMRWKNELMICTGEDVLSLDETMRQYMLDLLDGLKEELNTMERHAAEVA
ncbi:MAG: hypothetical protein NTZ72_13730 [Afipia sp.]|nr:hypothetical protein [Afipia sp.]